MAKNGMKHIWECILQQECVPKFLSIILHSNFSRSHNLKKEKKLIRPSIKIKWTEDK